MAGETWIGAASYALHPSGKWVYSINELTSTVDVLAWDAKNGTLKGMSQVPLRDPAYQGKSDAAELAIDRRGRFSMLQSQ